MSKALTKALTHAYCLGSGLAKQPSGGVPNNKFKSALAVKAVFTGRLSK